MRKLYSYRNRLSTRGTTTITDENGSNVYLINGRWGMHAGVMSVYSSSNLLEAEIKQRSLGMLPKFDLYKKRKYAGSRNDVREKAQLADHGQPFDLQLPRFSWSRMHHDHQRGPIGKRRLS